MQIDTDASSSQGVLVRMARDLPIYLVACTLLITCLALCLAYNIPTTGAGAIRQNAEIYFDAALAMLFVDVIWQLVRYRPGEPTRHLLTRYRQRLADPEVLAAMPLFAIAIVFAPFYSRLKSMIPLFNDFTWDPMLKGWDRTLFLGHDAADTLQPLLGYPLVTSVLAFLYHAWILLIYVGVLFFLFYRAARPVARQYFLSFVLIWTVVGAGLATVMASVGPCFVGPIFGDTTFDAHMAYLQAANEHYPVLTLDVQHQLLEWYREGKRGLGSGITAAPSLHVAMAQLTWLAVRRISPAFGLWFFAFFVMVWVGSVHLAYHYAVDGLIAVIATAAVWSASSAVLRLWDRWLAQLGGDAAAVPARETARLVGGQG